MYQDVCAEAHASTHYFENKFLFYVPNYSGTILVLVLQYHHMKYKTHYQKHTLPIDAFLGRMGPSASPFPHFEIC